RPSTDSPYRIRAARGPAAKCVLAFVPWRGGMEYPTRCLIVLAALTMLPGMPILGRDKAQRVNLQSLHPDQKVALTQTNGHKIKARFREFSESAITLQSKTGDISVQRADVQQVTVGSGLIRLRNSAIGMGIGAGIGALIATKTPAADHKESALGVALF